MAQPVIRTIAPDKAVTVSEPFRIQFVVENSNSNQRFYAPNLSGLKIIRGPEVYSGSQFIGGKKTEITNYVYTVVANKPGNYKINTASVKLKGLTFYGNEFFITAIKKEKLFLSGEGVDFSGYQLMPGEDPYRKIAENLFLKIITDKQTCFVGEPIVATFKLFSRLQSKSDIVKNPGFYGFSVYDMINLENKVKETEKLNGKIFEVHTIRKVQLYPITAGQFTIDEMKIENKVEFSKSTVNKKTEQEISEGVLHQENEEVLPSESENYETSLITKPVVINVKPLPVKNKPIDFNGAAGNFTIRASVEKNELDKNEEGLFIIKVEGKGNFTQITAPKIQWPGEVEGFEPLITDNLDKRNIPLSGSRIFKYPFISAKPGKWKLSPIKFSFFNISTNSYRNISTDSLLVNISKNEFKKKSIINTTASANTVSIEAANKKASRIAFTLVALLVLVIVVYLLIKEKRNKVQADAILIKKNLPLVDEIFETISIEENNVSDTFYSRLNQNTWSYLTQLYNLTSTEMNKKSLAEKMKQSGNTDQLIDSTLNLLIQIETFSFTKIDTEENRMELFEKTKSVLKEIKS